MMEEEELEGKNRVMYCNHGNTPPVVTISIHGNLQVVEKVMGTTESLLIYILWTSEE